MSRFSLFSAGFVACFCLADSLQSAQDPAPDEARRAFFERMLREFDKDGDGRLDTEERTAARRATEQFFARMEEPRGDRRRGAEVNRRNPEKGGDAKPERETKSESAGSPELLIQKFDKDGDGKLNDAEFAEMRKGAGQAAREPGGDRGPPNPPLGPMNPAVIQRFDRDGDGKLNEAEQAAAREAFSRMPGRPGGPPPNFEEFAKRFDRDGDGKLSEQEREAARGAFARMPGGPGGPFNPEEMIRRFDRDGDGKLNEAEQQAARAAFARGPGSGGPGGGGLLPGEGKGPDSKLDQEQLLKRFDKDGDGKLSDEERAAARAALAQ